MNSRPLTPLSADPNDLSILSPGHFLIGDSLKGMPGRQFHDLPSARLSLWQHVQQMRQHFWTRWHREYLHHLNVRKKWHNGRAVDVKVGDIVILHDDNLPPMQWTMGRITAIHPGSDKVVRVVTMNTKKGEYKRRIKKVSPLPIEEKFSTPD